MNEKNPNGSGADEAGGAPEAIVEGERRFSPIWLIPIVVVVIAGVLAYRAIEERGTKVVVLFQSAEGLVEGKSKVKFRDVEVGTVDKVEFRDMKTIEVHCTIRRGAEPYLTEDAEWWVVRPRIGGGGVSGLETLVSGAYLTLEPGTADKKRQTEFVGLEAPPVSMPDEPGVRLVLHAASLGGIETGASLYYRDLEAGKILGHSLSKDGKTIDIQVVVDQAYGDYVTTASRFWDAGGVDLSLGPGGLDVKTESLVSILHGGIAFDAPPGGEPVEAGHEFWLHESWADVERSIQTHGGLRLVLETGSLGGVATGNPVYYREMPVGSVVSHELSKDGKLVRVTVNVEPRYAKLVRSNSVFWNASGISANLNLSGLHVHAESLKSLLAGGVAFATPPQPGHTVSEDSVFLLHPEAKQEWLDWESDLESKKDDASETHEEAKGRFFHHAEKTEEEARKDDPSPEPSVDDHKHAYLHRVHGKGHFR
jgi:paraquat-inducible protein B